jgi:hypothetical protein
MNRLSHDSRRAGELLQPNAEAYQFAALAATPSAVESAQSFNGPAGNSPADFTVCG